LNNTKTRAIVAVLTAATLVVGLTIAATMTPSALAGGGKKDGLDKYMKGGQDGYKKGKQANGKDNGSNNGNTNTIQVLKQNAKSSAFTDGYKKDGQDKYMKGHDGYKKDGQDKYMKGHDGYKKDGQDKYMKGKQANGGKDNNGSLVEQNGQNVICTHLGSATPASCNGQNNGSQPPA
jgi:hypothetical protein